MRANKSYLLFKHQSFIIIIFLLFIAFLFITSCKSARIKNVYNNPVTQNSDFDEYSSYFYGSFIKEKGIHNIGLVFQRIEGKKVTHEYKIALQHSNYSVIAIKVKPGVYKLSSIICTIDYSKHYEEIKKIPINNPTFNTEPGCIYYIGDWSGYAYGSEFNTTTSYRYEWSLTQNPDNYDLTTEFFKSKHPNFLYKTSFNYFSYVYIKNINSLLSKETDGPGKQHRPYNPDDHFGPTIVDPNTLPKPPIFIK